MTDSTSLSARQRCTAPSLSFILNLIGVIAGGLVALVSLVAWLSPIGFFSGLVGAFFCLDPVRQSW